MNSRQTFIVAALVSLATPWAVAQSAAPAASAPPTASATSSPAKKDLIQKILAAQQTGIEVMAQQLAQQPAEMLLQRASLALQRVPADKRAAVAKDIQSDAKKYADEAVPIVRERALKLAPGTIGALLEEKFSEDELKQVLAILESPVNRKFQSLGPDMQRSLGEKLVAETRGAIEPKVQALEKSIARRLSATAPAAAGSAASGAKK